MCSGVASPARTVLVIDDDQISDRLVDSLPESADVLVAETSAEAADHLGPDVDLLLCHRTLVDEAGWWAMATARERELNCCTVLVQRDAEDVDPQDHGFDATLDPEADELRCQLTRFACIARLKDRLSESYGAALQLASASASDEESLEQTVEQVRADLHEAMEDAGPEDFRVMYRMFMDVPSTASPLSPELGAGEYA